MPNRLGQAYAFMAMTAIVPGRTESLRAYLEALPPAGESPLARIDTLHFGRWVIVTRFEHQGPPQEKRDELKNHYLLFSADFDGDLEPFLDAICERLPSEADEIWGHCVAYPGTADRSAFARYMRHNQIETSMPTGAYATTPLTEIRDALAIREKLSDLAVRAQTLDAAELRRAYREAFAPQPGSGHAP